MGGILLIYASFILGWRGYGWRLHLVVAAAIIVAMTIIVVFGAPQRLPGMLFGVAIMTIVYEIMCILPCLGVGLGARNLFGRGEPYSLNFSFKD